MQTVSSVQFAIEGGTASSDDFASITPVPTWIAPLDDGTISEETFEDPSDEE